MLLKNVRRTTALLPIVAACAALAACGGGGGDAQLADASAPAASSPAADAAASGAATDPAAVDGSTSGSSTAVADEGATGDGESAAASAPVDFGGGSMLVASQQAAADDPAPSDAAADPQADERETAQSLSLDSNDYGYAKPKVAALDYDASNNGSTKQALLAKFKFVVLGARMGSTLQSLTNGIHARNGATEMAIYTVPTETSCSQPSSSNTYAYPIWNAVQKTNWWLRKADGSKSQWTTTWGACDINFTNWARRDSSGRTWPQYRAQYDRDHLLRYAPAVKWWFADNGFGLPRVSADWRRIGTNQSKTDPTIISNVRTGMVNFWDQLNNGGQMRVMANVDTDLSFSPYQGRLRGAFYEGAMGRSWSFETWSGWSTTMNRYRALLRNTYGHLALFQVYGGTTDYRMMRYGLASALLENGWFVYTPSSGTMKPSWYDEYDARIGTPVEGPPTGPKQNGIWMRRYSNGLVLVNPSKVYTRSIYVGSGYKRLKGTQDSGVNNGQVQSTVTLGPRHGLLMIRN